VNSQGPIKPADRARVEKRPIAKIWSLVTGSCIWMPEARENLGPERIFCVRRGHCGHDDLNVSGYDHPAIILGSHSQVVKGELYKYVTVAQGRITASYKCVCTTNEYVSYVRMGQCNRRNIES
jgi:hypothetical protein